jgi:glycine hydroxymethyltransferase
LHPPITRARNLTFSFLPLFILKKRASDILLFGISIENENQRGMTRLTFPLPTNQQPGFSTVGTNQTDHAQLYVYPIKSLRPTKITEGELTKLGFRYDRRFMLLKVIPGENENGSGPTLKNMHIPEYPEMGLFQTEIEEAKGESEGDTGRLIVTYNPPSSSDTKDNTESSDSEDSQARRLEIPLEPETATLKPFTVTMHSSPTTGYDMGSRYNDWFSACFGYPVVLAYLGTNTRSVLGTLAPAKRNNESWWRIWKQELVLPSNGHGNKMLNQWLVPFSLGYLVLNAVSWCHARIENGTSSPAVAIGVTALALTVIWTVVNILVNRRHEARIGFADCAPFLVVSQTSVDDVSGRLEGDVEVDLTKFRPNVVVEGAEVAFEEDFWAELAVGSNASATTGKDSKIKLLLTGNCVRCQSLNVDFSTGKMGTGEAGSVLKKLMKDRRVDRGARFSPVFGRYSFLGGEGAGERMRVGDEVVVLRKGEEYTVTGKSASESWNVILTTGY